MIISTAILHNKFGAVFFDALDDSDQSDWCVTLWSLWKCQNKKMWENKHFSEWPDACAMDVHDVAPGAPSDIWTKPQGGWVKCDVDAAFSFTANNVGIGICLRDERGTFIKAKTHCFSSIMDVFLGETMGLQLAISWVHEMGYNDVILEMDAKFVVNTFNSNTIVI